MALYNNLALLLLSHHMRICNTVFQKVILSNTTQAFIHVVPAVACNNWKASLYLAIASMYLPHASLLMSPPTCTSHMSLYYAPTDGSLLSNDLPHSAANDFMLHNILQSQIQTIIPAITDDLYYYT